MLPVESGVEKELSWFKQSAEELQGQDGDTGTKKARCIAQRACGHGPAYFEIASLVAGMVSKADSGAFSSALMISAAVC